MNIEDISTQLMYTTVPVYATMPNGDISCGTGFIFSVQQTEEMSIPLLITNYHVVHNANDVCIEMHVSTSGKPTHEVVRARFGNELISNGKLRDLDLVVFPIAGALTAFQQKGIEVFYRSIDFSVIPTEDIINSLSAVESITFIGYPNSIYDINNKIPVVRQGITATPIWNDFQGNEQFLIDAGVFPGSSGSPVFIYNQGSYPTKDGIAIGSRVLFVGVLTKTLQRKNDGAYLDLGVVINSKAFSLEVNDYIKRITGNTKTD